ncbi:hypothetical protein TNCV_2380301 [Trichonephila clavipes]|nr:hypothetical protein TNCV_2380301 [Trichonephila clavipes]
MAPWARRLGCVLACYAPIRRRSRDFGDLRIRRSEGRVVNTPLVFKRVLFQETRRDPKKRKKRGNPKGEVEEKSSEKTWAVFFLGSGEENPRVLFRDADQESKTRMRNNALRTGPSQAVERAVSKRGYHTGYRHGIY